MLPIEEGCNAIVINSEAGNDGKSVVVGKFIGDVPLFCRVDLWEVDKLMKTIDIFSSGREGRGPDVYLASEKNLMRIDGDICDLELGDSEELIMKC